MSSSMQYAQIILKRDCCLDYVTVRAKFTKSLKQFLHSDGGPKLNWFENSRAADVTFLSKLGPSGHGV